MNNGEQRYQSSYKENNQTLPINQFLKTRNRSSSSEYKPGRYLPNAYEENRYEFSHNPLNKSLSNTRVHRNQENSKTYETRNNSRSSVNLNKNENVHLYNRNIEPYEGFSRHFEITKYNNEKLDSNHYIQSSSSQKYLTLPIERVERKQGKIYANRFHQEQEKFESKNFDYSPISIEEVRETRKIIENEKKRHERFCTRDEREEMPIFTHIDNQIARFRSMTSPLKSQSQSRVNCTQLENPGTNLTPKRQNGLVKPAESVYSISKRETVHGSELSPICLNKMKFMSTTPNREHYKKVCLDNSGQSRKQEVISREKNLRDKMNEFSIDKNMCDLRFESKENRNVGLISREEILKNNERFNRIQSLKNREYQSSFKETENMIDWHEKAQFSSQIQIPQRLVIKEQKEEFLGRMRNGENNAERIESQHYSASKPIENKYLNRINALNIKINDKINAIKNVF